jgi:hypothetical protein
MYVTLLYRVTFRFLTFWLLLAFRKGCNTVPINQDPKFIGREGVIKEIDQQLKANRRVAISGIGGVGYV